MDKRDRFIKELETYYLYLTLRFEKGYDYLLMHTNKDAVDLYNNIVQELSAVEGLINYYKMNK